MPQDAARLRQEFDRIALLTSDRSEEARYQDRLLRYVPRPCAAALDVGCGTGSLARSLALRADRVVAVDLSPQMVAVAREASRQYANLEFLLGDFLALDLPAGSFDCITSVATLHHVSWVSAVERAKQLLRSGGVLLIVDLVQDAGLWDRLVSGVAFALRAFGGKRQPRELRDAWAEHGRGDTYLTLYELKRLCRQHLPGARVRRHLFWRYSVIWSKAD